MARAGHPRSPRTGLILIASGAVVVSQGYGACRSEVPGLRRDFAGIVVAQGRAEETPMEQGVNFADYRFDFETGRLWSGEQSMDVRCLSARFTS